LANSFLTNEGINASDQALKEYTTKSQYLTSHFSSLNLAEQVCRDFEPVKAKLMASTLMCWD
jgi:hypothetical protein